MKTFIAIAIWLSLLAFSAAWQVIEAKQINPSPHVSFASSYASGLSDYLTFGTDKLTFGSDYLTF